MKTSVWLMLVALGILAIWSATAVISSGPFTVTLPIAYLGGFLALVVSGSLLMLVSEDQRPFLIGSFVAAVGTVGSLITILVT